MSSISHICQPIAARSCVSKAEKAYIEPDTSEISTAVASASQRTCSSSRAQEQRDMAVDIRDCRCLLLVVLKCLQKYSSN